MAPWEKEDESEAKIRQIMNSRKITYQEAEKLVKQGQKALFEF